MYFQGQHVVLNASQVIDKILYGPGLVGAGLGNPATDSTTPDIIVTLKPGYIWVGNRLNFTFKRAEHGGFSEDDTHIPLIVSGGALSQSVRGTTVDTPVQTEQIAVTALNALGLNRAYLQGAVIEGTQGLPGLGLPQDTVFTLTAGQSGQALVGAFYDASTTDNLSKYKVIVNWDDGLSDKNVFLIRDTTNLNIVDVWDSHNYETPGSYDGTVDITPPAGSITPPAGSTTTETFTARVLDNLTSVGQTLQVNANTPLTLQKVATLVAQDTNATKGDFTARIDWGDGYQSNGVVADTGTPGAFAVLGSHTYVGHQDAKPTITVYITDKLGSETVAQGEAIVTFVPPSQSSGTTPAPNPPGTPAGPQPPQQHHPAGLVRQPGRHSDGCWVTSPSASP